MVDNTALTADELLSQVGWLRRLARGLLADPAEAADAAQDAVVAALESPPADRSSVRGWFSRVLVNRVRSTLRADRRRAARHLAAGDDIEPTRTPEDVASQLEVQRQIVTAVMRLPERSRQVLFLRFYDDLPPTEIARHLGIPAGTVRWRLKTALDELRAHMDAQPGARRWRMLLLPLAPARRLRAPFLTAVGLGAAVAVGGAVHLGSGGHQSAVAAARPPRPLRPPVFVAPAAVAGEPGGGSPTVPLLAMAPTGGEAPPCPDGMDLKRAPFTAVRWRGDLPEVEIDGRFTELVAIDGLAAETLVTSARLRFPRPPELWRKRLSEDLVELMCGLGHPPGDRVSVSLRGGDGSVQVTQQPMSHERRQQVWRRNQADAGVPAPPPDRFPRLSPFTDLRLAGDAIRVALEPGGAPFDLLSIDGLAATRLLTHCRDQFQGLCEKRLAEDLVEVLDGLGVHPGPTVRLQLADPVTGARSVHEKVPLTAENRRRIYEARHPR
jgi:RNA polymerase sigma-70 factor (ECF subfamily)